MKNKILIIAGFFLVTAVFFSCKKSELQAYEMQDMVYIVKDYNSAITDSLTYSFAIRDEALMQDTVFVPVRIMGVAKDFDREIKVGVVDTATAATAGTDYEILPTKIPAGSYTSEIPVLLHRSASLATVSKRLKLIILASKDFQPGIPNDKALGYSYPGSATTCLIVFNDYLTKPANWDTWLKYFFGSYSQVKYKFVIDVTGRSEFPSGATGLPYGQMTYYKQVCKNALAEYESANGPLIDEFGQQVSF